MRRIGEHFVLSLLPVLCALSSCAPAKIVVADASTISAASVLERVKARASRIQNLIAHGTLTVERQNSGDSGSFDMVLKKPDSLVVKLSGPFGIDAGAVLITPQEFRFYNRFSNQLVIGPTTRGNLRSLFHLDIEYDDILTIFSGMIPVNDETLIPTFYGVDENQYFLTFGGGGDVQEYWIDPESFTVSRYHLIDGQGKLLVDGKTTVRNDVNGAVLPRSVRFTFHRQRTRVSIFYDKVTINVPGIRPTFSVPSDVEKVYW